jgi:glycosyltransferase involved in cell wall biosynthesis
MRISAGQTIGGDRGSAVLCVMAVAERDPALLVREALATLRSAVDGVGAFAPLLLVGPGVVVDPVLTELGASISSAAMKALTVDASAGPTAAANAAIRASAPADILLICAGLSIGPRELGRLRAAALSDSTVASATPLFVGRGRGSDHDVESQPGLLPRIATMGPDCVYLRRAALDLIGGLDGSLSLSEALDTAAVRLVALGMVHVAADEVVVEPRASPDEPSTPAEGLSTAIQSRNPVQETIACDERGVLRRAIRRGGAGDRRLSVTIDGRSLTSVVGGTQTYVTGLTLALAAEGSVAVRVLAPPDLPDHTREAFLRAGGIELLTYEQALANPPLTDIVHRPQQVFTPDDLALLRLVGERVVVTHQDLIAYHNHAYHADVEAWRGHRRTTRLAMAVADQVIFFSEHARRDALAEDLVPTDRTHVVGVGAEQPQVAGETEKAPDGIGEDEPFLLCLGADYAHKNRPFAIGLLVALREMGWPGRLVFAGPHVQYGSSSEDELGALRLHPDIAASVIDLGAIDEPSKRWLYARARALLYPTTYEGFGLLPLEAAAWRLPCLFASQSALAEAIGEAATLVPWDARASAVGVLPLLEQGQARVGHLATLTRLKTPSWEEVVRDLLDVYAQAVTGPSSQAAPRAWQELERESHIAALDGDIRHLKDLAQEYQDAYHSLMRRVSGGLPLIDDGGLLSPAQQRGLMRVAGRGRLGSLLLAPLGLIGRRGA